MLHDAEIYQSVAIEEARRSLREGNHGFGAVIVRDGQLVAQAHDLEESCGDPTAHAEMLAIRTACRMVGKSLHGCRMYSTHEPCPMCSTAVVWSGLGYLGYGYGIADALAQGRTRIDLGCRELFRRANAEIQVEDGILRNECALLYDQKIRKEVRRLRGATDLDLEEQDRVTARKRAAWIKNELKEGEVRHADLLGTAYALFLKKLCIAEEEAPVVARSDREIVIHSSNLCPTLEACRILGLDTRRVCRLSNEGATIEMMKTIDPRLSFKRNYEKLRPYAGYCEESITLD